MRQTAVEWLYEEIDNKDMGEIPIWIYQLLEQAKELEKQQIIEANMSARLEVSNSILQKKTICEKSEQYYNETYNQNKI